jgi:hypothetical protein
LHVNANSGVTSSIGRRTTPPLAEPKGTLLDSIAHDVALLVVRTRALRDFGRRNSRKGCSGTLTLISIQEWNQDSEKLSAISETPTKGKRWLPGEPPLCRFGKWD